MSPMSKQEPSTYRPFVFTVIEDDGVNVEIEGYSRTPTIPS